MLGQGRPFVLELENAKMQTLAPEDIAQLAADINQAADGLAEVHELRMATRAACDAIQEAEQTKTKTYRCVVHLSKPVTKAEVAAQQAAILQAGELVVQQKTPIRVLHRRSLMTRPKILHSIKMEFVNSHWLIVDLHAQAGMYIKEFVHGDMGRSQPSLGSLFGCEANIIQLDVLDVVDGGKP
eukprot:TRINITY_DN23165_c0_g1_i2.p1 TRINITY_DN23165_c0_g1~~TRINITY_DN23165_c0_g1_i2.p1  ORF type:complete len:183 (-),score=66.36 TRINITY_DN23165_c0_g1_i2:130-678(-)